MSHCCVPDCSSTKKCRRYMNLQGISFHEFPSNLELREKWLKSINRGNDWVPSDRSSVCSLHFTKDDYREGVRIRILKSDAVPSDFEPQEQPVRLGPEAKRKKKRKFCPDIPEHGYTVRTTQDDPDRNTSNGTLVGENESENVAPPTSRQPYKQNSTSCQALLEHGYTSMHITSECRIKANAAFKVIDDTRTNDESDTLRKKKTGRPRRSVQEVGKLLASKSMHIKRLTNKVERLKKKLAESELEKKEISLSAKMQKIESDKQKGVIEASLLADLVQNYGIKTKRWCTTSLEQFSVWRCIYPRGYEHGRRSLQMPSKSTLNRFANNCTAGTDLIEQCVQTEAEIINENGLSDRVVGESDLSENELSVNELVVNIQDLQSVETVEYLLESSETELVLANESRCESNTSVC